MTVTALDRCRLAWEAAGLVFVDGPGGTATAQAPGHSVVDRSVSFRQIDGMVLVNSHADDKATVLEAVGLSIKDLFDEPRGAVYRYPGGSVVHRSPEKKFTQSPAAGDRSLYRADELPDDLTVPVYVVEGEKDADTARSVGAYAVSTRQGASTKADRWDWSPLNGRTVVVVQDRDDKGKDHARDVAATVGGIAASVALVEAAEGKDLADHVMAGHNLDELVEVDYRLSGGDELLDLVAAAIGRYCILPSPHALTGVVLWVACTHLTPAFEYAPRLVLRSVEKRSGKSRVLEVVDALVHDPLRAVNATTSYVFRSLDKQVPPTLLLDEADTIFGSKKVAENNEDLRGLLNAGFQRGLTFGRTVGPNHEPKEFATFAMAALAGIGQMPDTIEDRAVVVVMRRRKRSEMVYPYRVRRDQPVLHDLAGQLAVWAKSVLSKATGHEPDNLGVEDRAADVWEPLVTVADMAGGRWPVLAREAARFMVNQSEEESEEVSLNIRLLSDIRDVFDKQGATFLPSAHVCELLRGIEESPWDQFELTPSKLGHRLREYGIRSGHNEQKTKRGFRRVAFCDAWERYLTPVGVSDPVQAVHSGVDLHKRRDTLNVPDALEVSGDFKASDDNPSSDGVRAGVDALGRVSTRDEGIDAPIGARVRESMTPSDDSLVSSAGVYHRGGDTDAPGDGFPAEAVRAVLCSLSPEHPLDVRTLTGSVPTQWRDLVPAILARLETDNVIAVREGRYVKNSHAA